jgi:hypothetical protein
MALQTTIETMDHQSILLMGRLDILSIGKEAKQKTLARIEFAPTVDPAAAEKPDRSLDPECRRFFESKLCRFSSRPFYRLGDDFRKLLAGKPLQSPIFRIRQGPHRSES